MTGPLGARTRIHAGFAGRTAFSAAEVGVSVALGVLKRWFLPEASPLF
jgi:hypothetical protein